ncbi:MAG: heme exporter protein CcmD [Phyllobacteriaceae bacterium]|nr:heme exporter protein CcmD [Phyllobacteriaceae bacterium]
MFGKHAAFIIPSYGITALVIVVLVAWITITYRQRRREIGQLEESAAARRGGNVSTDRAGQ